MGIARASRPINEYDLGCYPHFGMEQTRTYQSWSPKEGSCNGLCQELTFRAAWLDSGLPFSRTLAAGASPGESPSVVCDRSGHLCPVSADVLAKAPTLHALLDHVVEVGDAALPVLHSDTRP